MLEACDRSCRLLSLAPTTTPFLHGNNLLISGKVDVQNSSKLAAVEKVSKGRALRPKNAWSETNTHIVIVHFVLVMPMNHLTFQKSHQMHKNLSVERRKLWKEIQNERNLFFRLHLSFRKDVQQFYIQRVGNNWVFQLCKKFLDHSSYCIATILI